MRRILTIKAEIGMIAAGDVYSEESQLIIPKGTTITQDILDKLKLFNVYDFFISDVNDEIPYDYTYDELEQIILGDSNESDYYEKLRLTEEFKKFEAKFLDSVEKVKGSINDIVYKNGAIDVVELVDSVKRIIVGRQPSVNIFDMMHCIERYDDLTYVHCLNVALICNVIGQWFGMTDEELDVLTVSGLMHDIGKVMIPNEVIKKPGKLTISEYAIVQTHTIHGYNILKSQSCDERIKLVALQHHERCDCKGYPNKLGSQEIENFAKIVAIADVYDAMTSNRVYRAGICPFDVISTFEDNIDTYDPKFLVAFLEKIAQSYINAEVYINNNLEGTIVMLNKYALGKPGVLVGGAFVDLSRSNDMRITSLK